MPLGGHKGYALSLMIDLLCGILSGADFGPHIGKLYGDFDRAAEHRPPLLGDRHPRVRPDSTSSRRASTRCARRSPRSSWPTASSRIFVPGEIEDEETQRRLAAGIPIPTRSSRTSSRWANSSGCRSRPSALSGRPAGPTPPDARGYCSQPREVCRAFGPPRADTRLLRRRGGLAALQTSGWAVSAGQAETRVGERPALTVSACCPLQLHKYWKTAAMAAASYIGDSPLFLIDYALRFVRVAVLLAIWRVILEGRPEVSGMTIASVLTYTLIAEVFADQLDCRIEMETAIWEGTIATRLLQPLGLVGSSRPRRSVAGCSPSACSRCRCCSRRRSSA